MGNGLVEILPIPPRRGDKRDEVSPLQRPHTVREATRYANLLWTAKFHIIPERRQVSVRKGPVFKARY